MEDEVGEGVDIVVREGDMEYLPRMRPMHVSI